MTKFEFLSALRDRLSGLPQEDVEERLNFYSEMIEDRIEDGLSEKEAVFEVGSVNEIADQIIADIPFVKIAKEKIKPKRRLKVWEIVFLVLGSPIWLSLVIAVFSVILSLYISLWAVIISLWAVFASLVGCAFGGIAGGVVFAFYSNIFTGIAMAGAGIVSAGLSIFMFFGCKAVTKGILLLTKKIVLGVKKEVA